MCGPSASQKELASQASAFSNLLQRNYTENFGKQSQILGSLMTMFTPIAEAGPDQQGFGKQELATLNTQAGEGVAANYAKTQQALNTTLGARGGGNEFLPTGSEAQLRAALAESGAKEMSQEQLAITRANYDQGRQNWGQATAGLNALSKDYNPSALASESINAGQTAFGEATKVRDMENQRQAAIAGGITSLAKGALGFATGGISNVLSGGAEAGSETGGGVEQFFSGGLSALSG